MCSTSSVVPRIDDAIREWRENGMPRPAFALGCFWLDTTPSPPTMEIELVDQLPCFRMIESRGPPAGIVQGRAFSRRNSSPARRSAQVHVRSAARTGPAAPGRTASVRIEEALIEFFQGGRGLPGDVASAGIAPWHRLASALHFSCVRAVFVKRAERLSSPLAERSRGRLAGCCCCSSGQIRSRRRDPNAVPVISPQVRAVETCTDDHCGGMIDTGAT